MMQRKGQYLALETVLSLAISIIVATAVIATFDSYRNSVMEDIHERNAVEIQSEVLNSVYALKHLDTGSSLSLEFPEASGSEYTVSFEDRELKIDTGPEVFTREVTNTGWASELRGSVTTTDVQLIKLGNDEIVLRPD